MVYIQISLPGNALRETFIYYVIIISLYGQNLPDRVASLLILQH
jgi:hypothetical protein